MLQTTNDNTNCFVFILIGLFLFNKLLAESYNTTRMILFFFHDRLWNKFYNQFLET